MSCGPYVPAIRADFGRTITDKEINNEFQRIEEVLECICNAVTDNSNVVNWSYDNGVVTEETILLSSNGLIQYLTVEGDVNITIAKPDIAEPKLITLVIADGGSGRFNFPSGLTWTTDSNGNGMDGKPWDSEGTGGDYGAFVTCIYDGFGWVYLVFARNDIDRNELADVADVFNWR